ncbi:hypothetical protein CC78DRAFT_573242 [Lojkania enalia]|uniref:BTB domain-containing protein n=1 Tax=Lojkania enalia TaxID=147567 RepID=A0A9P4ND17_9PLEO|nr:hypothetical protein CC78DRAFT_573242 [Didymosphaeria enalia]
MTSSFEEILRSDIFTFYVGKGKTNILVHAAALAATSEPMKILIHGPMSEAETRSAELPDVYVDDFIRFCEYAYHGDYTPPSWTIDEKLLVEEGWISTYSLATLEVKPQEPPKKSAFYNGEKAPADGIENWGFSAAFGGSSSTLKKKKRLNKSDLEFAPITAQSPRVKLRNEIRSQNYLVDGDPKEAILARFVPQGNTSANQNFTGVFLAHARLYSFANMYLVEPLKALALHKLQKTLNEFNIFNRRVGDIIELIRYTYSSDHTPDRKEDGTIDPLRKLVVEYTVYEIDKIGKSREFVELVEEGGELFGDFWGIVSSSLL